jgi:squalene-hopene/tetraprenyl-beta-curcumene cyclase
MVVSPNTSGALLEARRNARQALLQRLTPRGHWVGCLSSSALSTAVAVVALSWMKQEPALIENGLEWLARHQAPDGGWGDTPESPSNPSTTLLCWAAFRRCAGPASRHAATLQHVEQWLWQRLGSLQPLHIADRIIELYGNDRTFSVPILALCTACGCLGLGPQAWRHIPQLPFELAALPHQVFKWLRLPVVSYAIPALIAIGLMRHQNFPQTGFPPLRRLRESLKPTVLRVLHQSQPATGGFLEAVPLTGFVVLALAASGLKQHPVAQAGWSFLGRTARADGSWPIDVNLSTWLTSLSIGAMAVPVKDSASTHLPNQDDTLQWLLAQQHRCEHPFTHAEPGGWAWTDLPGGVPDADDTAGVLLALHYLDAHSSPVRAAAISGLNWLLRLQNRDGGVPTFCRGWSNLPFDRSCPDITAHALAAWSAWQSRMSPELLQRIQAASHRALRYLCRAQHPDGTWLPLWFGSQHSPNHANPLYGTARVLLALQQLPPPLRLEARLPITRALAWLVETQQPQGGWGASLEAPPTIEETALALDALAAADSHDPAVLKRGLSWFLQATQNGTRFPPSPIGLYFSKLWYSEELYPIIFSASALARLAGKLD